MKVLLISANTNQLNMPAMPYGMACVATAVRMAGHEVQTINAMTPMDIEALVPGALDVFKPDVIGISIRNIDDQCMASPVFLLESVKPIVKMCRQLSEAVIVLGGAGYSIFPQSTLEYLGADMGIQGEGEVSFVALLDSIERKKPVDSIPGLFIAGRGPLSDMRFEKNLDRYLSDLPEPNMLSHPDIDQNEVWLPFQARRGCPMNCSYCTTSITEGRKIRKYDIDSVVSILEKYKEAGYDQFFFTDSNFNIPPSYAEALCDRIIQRRLDVKWQAIIYPHKTDEKLIDKMARAGCVTVPMGFESGVTEVLELMNKKFVPETVRDCSCLFKNNGIDQIGFLLLGGPGETRETVLRSLDFADSLDLEIMKVTIGIRIYPFTALADIAVKQGVVEPDNDLLFPEFYLASGLDGWIQEIIEDYMKNRPNWIL